MSVKILIFGNVQGVFFRSFIKEKADLLNICGFTRNLDDGTVEIIAQGTKKSLNKLTEYVKTGPKLAKVEKIKVVSYETEQEFEEFRIIT